jgi:mannose/cellobiose epimerase-like protein (N-acyl-D-glucosamine 2-epimerase family)
MPHRLRNTTVKAIAARVGRLIEPRGESEWGDRVRLLLWDQYAAVQGLGVRVGAAHRRMSGPRARAAQPAPVKGPYDSDFFRKHLLQDLLPFWEKHSVDRSHGGFLTHLARSGSVYDSSLKMSPMQGRMVYAFAIGYDLSSDQHYRQIAEQGFQFLVTHCWDDRFGGWYRSVSRDGRPKDPDKHLCDQAYALIGLIEYYRVTRDPLARQYIAETCAALDRHGWDEKYGGYYQRCARDWAPIWTQKTICAQLDMMTALLLLSQLDEETGALPRLLGVADLIKNRMFDQKYQCVLETFHRNWVYDPLRTRDQIEFGHNLKAAWLLLELHRLTGEAALCRYAGRLVDYSLRFGWDHRHQGFYQHAHRNGVLASTEKLWWPECEGLAALLLINRLSSDPVYLEYFQRLADFSFTYLFDREYGEWFTSCYPDGTVKDDRKGYAWKAAYHTVQACFYAQRYLDEADTPQLSGLSYESML